MLEDIIFHYLYVCKLAIHVLHLVVHTTPHPPQMSAFASRRARASCHCLAFLMLTTERGKVIQLRDRIVMN